MKTRTVIFFLFLAFSVFGCTSVPDVRKANLIEKDKYDVVIDRDYLDNPDELKYAVNSFVMEKGGTSYSIEKYGSNDFYITIPGDTPVEDLPQIRHFHVGRTLGATLPPSIGLGVILLILLLTL